MIDALERIGHVLRTVLRSAARAEGVSVTQAELLLRLADTGESAPGELAAWLDVRAPTVTDALASLTGKGLVDTVPDPLDARRRQVRLTGAGTSAAARLGEWDRGIRQEVEAVLGNGSDLVSGLLAVIARLQRAGFISVARTCVTCRFFRPRLHPGAEAPDHCGLIDAPLGPTTLRLDCPEHEPVA